MGIFSHNGNITCPSHPTGPQYGSKHVAGSMTFHDLSIVLAGAFTAASCLISFIAYMRQALHFSNPNEQTKILRIIALIPAYAIISFLSVAFPNAATYLEPWTDVYESAALASFFLLLLIYLVPVPEKQEAYFDRLPSQNAKGEATGGGSLGWFHKTWICVFQYCFFALVVAVAADVTQAVGVFCASSSKPHFAHIWLEVIRSISVTVAALNVINFYRRLKSPLAPHGAFIKLLGIKGIVFLGFIQNIIFTILHSTNALKPTDAMSYNDITFVLPNLLLCIEMVLFSFLHLYAFNSTPYHLGPGAKYEGGPLGIRAIAAACNPLEIIQGCIQAVVFLTGGGMRGSATRYQDVGIEPLRYQAPNNSPPPYPNTYPYQGPADVARAQDDVERGVRDTSQSPDAHERRGGGGYTPLTATRY